MSRGMSSQVLWRPSLCQAGVVGAQGLVLGSGRSIGIGLLQGSDVGRWGMCGWPSSCSVPHRNLVAIEAIRRVGHLLDQTGLPTSCCRRREVCSDSKIGCLVKV